MKEWKKEWQKKEWQNNDKRKTESSNTKEERNESHRGKKKAKERRDFRENGSVDSLLAGQITEKEGHRPHGIQFHKLSRLWKFIGQTLPVIGDKLTIFVLKSSFNSLQRSYSYLHGGDWDGNPSINRAVKIWSTKKYHQPVSEQPNWFSSTENGEVKVKIDWNHCLDLCWR